MAKGAKSDGLLFLYHAFLKANEVTKIPFHNTVLHPVYKTHNN